MMGFRERAAAGLAEGDCFTLTRRFSEQDIHDFALISRDYNPVHFDTPYAALRNFRAPICQGLLTAGLMTEIGGQIGWLASGMTLRFKRPVYAGDTVTCDWMIIEVDSQGRGRAEVTMRNAEGEVVLEAETAGIAPGVKEKERLVEMLREGDPSNMAARAES
ncbi:Acyl dehydratase [Pseudomonas flavescens]|uniref:Acyl dehydratase n=1 Tax=Phytopseudomonas flavescens TaxID=29435 RepID=A0A1G7XT92_9GAMM|nr:MaoC family dehydratase [Pseudomonas flavescens]SDG87397.1 Acyl dehydratase [Pseudomonas flavescens]